MAHHPVMATPDGLWRVQVVTARGGQLFRVRRRGLISSRGWAPIGQLRHTVAEVEAMLGEAFADLVEA